MRRANSASPAPVSWSGSPELGRGSSCPAPTSSFRTAGRRRGRTGSTAPGSAPAAASRASCRDGWRTSTSQGYVTRCPPCSGAAFRPCAGHLRAVQHARCSASQPAGEARGPTASGGQQEHRQPLTLATGSHGAGDVVVRRSHTSTAGTSTNWWTPSFDECRPADQGASGLPGNDSVRTQQPEEPSGQGSFDRPKTAGAGGSTAPRRCFSPSRHRRRWRRRSRSTRSQSGYLPWTRVTTAHTPEHPSVNSPRPAAITTRVPLPYRGSGKLRASLLQAVGMLRSPEASELRSGDLRQSCLVHVLQEAAAETVEHVDR